MKRRHLQYRQSGFCRGSVLIGTASSELVEVSHSKGLRRAVRSRDAFLPYVRLGQVRSEFRTWRPRRFATGHQIALHQGVDKLIDVSLPRRQTPPCLRGVEHAPPDTNNVAIVVELHGNNGLHKRYRGPRTADGLRLLIVTCKRLLTARVTRPSRQIRDHFGRCATRLAN